MRAIAIVTTMILANFPPVAEALEFHPIANPTSTYVDGTTLMSLASIPNDESLTSLPQGPQTVTFDSAMIKWTVPTNWETWGAPPFTETATPLILYHDGVSPLQVSLSQASRTFGFELQGAEQLDSNFIVRFYAGAMEVGSVERTVSGDAGARLFAAYSTSDFFSHVVIENPGGNSGGWAIANIRYSTTAVPEPSTYVMGMIATVATASIIRRKRKNQVATAR